MDIVKDFIFPIVTAIVTATIGWFFGRKKQRAETELQLLENTNKAIGMYRQIIDDQAAKYDMLLKKHNDLLIESEKTLQELKQLRMILRQREDETLIRPLEAELEVKPTSTSRTKRRPKTR